MSMSEFLSRLTHLLGYLPYAEVKRTIDFYREAIEDRMEDGMTESEAVAAVGSIEDIVREIEMNLPLSTVVRTRVDGARSRAVGRRSGIGPLGIVAVVLTSPIWLSLLAAALGILIAVFAVAAAVAIVATSLIVCGLVTAVSAFILPYPAFPPRLMLAGAGLAAAAVGLGLIPIAGLVEKCVKGFFRSIGTVVKRSILRKKGARA